MYNDSLNEQDPEAKRVKDLSLKVSDFADSVREKAGDIKEDDNTIVDKVVNALPN
jgi:hypothetical protein